MSPNAHTEYKTPPAGQAVTRFDNCPCFAERRTILAADPICWFCKYAAFDLFSDKLPECGTCCHPVAQDGNAEQDKTELSEKKGSNQ